MSMEDRALAARQEQQDEQREEAQRDALRYELDRLRDEEALAATLVATAAETVFRNDPRDGDPVVTFARLRERTAAYVVARDNADNYQREHGLDNHREK